MSQSTSKKTHRAARYVVVAAVVAALLTPLGSQHLRAADEPADKAALADKAKPLTATPKVDPATVVASAGKVELTAGEFEQFIAGLPPEQQTQITSEPAEKRRLADHLLKMKAMVGEAERRKLAEDPKIKDQLAAVRKQIDAQYEEARKRVLLQALFSGMQGDEASDKKYFEEHKGEFGKVQARHILVSTRGSNDPANPKAALTDEQAKKKADDIRARLVKGEDFAAIAKKESDDPGSKETGGEYTFGRGAMVPEFEEAAYGLKENEISQPVKTEHGYHVIQLQKRVPGTYEEARAQIPRQRVEALLKDLTGGAKTKFNDAFLGGAAGTTDEAKAAPAEPTAKSDKK